MTSTIAPAISGSTEVTQLIAIALRGLSEMYRPRRRLFCHRIQLTSAGTERVGISRRYTMMCLLGLQRASDAGISHSFDLAEILHSLLRDLTWLDNSGDLGLLIWLCASSGQGELEQLQAGLDINEALQRYRDAGMGRTMETAWLLTGLAHAGMTSATQQRDLSDLAEKTYRILSGNLGKSGLFGHGARLNSLAGAIRGHIGSFADQVYPILALSHFARAYEREEAYAQAVACAHAICGRQGPQGQWWWHYDSKSGKVVERYPVYSVHQHGMGPMALRALQGFNDHDFQPWIARSLGWLEGPKEAEVQMKDTARGLIWRSVYQRPAAKWRERLHLGEGTESTGSTRVLRECWSYELGWLLYALVPEAGGRSCEKA